MNTLPKFEIPFLNEVAESFVKKRKSLAYDASDLRFNKVHDIVDGKKVEKIEIFIRSSLSRNAAKMRLYVWGDRWIWIDARKAKKSGWEWEFSKDGRLTGCSSPRQLMETFKKFYSASYHFNSKSIENEAGVMWRKILATGPIAVDDIKKNAATTRIVSDKMKKDF